MKWEDKLYRLQYGYGKGLLGGITDAVGLTDHKGQAKREAEAQRQAEASRQASAELGKESLEMSKAELEFQREQYKDWQAIYGTLQEQLNDFYVKVDAGLQTAQALQNLQQESQTAESNLTQNLAQRGLSGSGLEAEALAGLTSATALQRAGIRAQQDEVAAGQRMNFLGLGLGQGAQLLGNVAAMGQTGVQAGVNLAGQQMSGASSLNALQGNMAGLQNQARMNLTNQLFQTGRSTFSTMKQFSDRRLKDNIKLVHSQGPIKFYTWTWNALANSLGLMGTGYGVIAQEVPTKYVDSKGKYLQVDYKLLWEDIQNG